MDLRFERLRRGGRQRPRVRISREQRRRDHVHPLVGGLCGQDGGGQQFERVAVTQFGIRIGMLRLQSIQDVTGLERRFHVFGGQWMGSEPLFHPTLLYDSEKARQCS